MVFSWPPTTCVRGSAFRPRRDRRGPFLPGRASSSRLRRWLPLHTIVSSASRDLRIISTGWNVLANCAGAGVTEVARYSTRLADG
jgi:hypothetical protein